MLFDLGGLSCLRCKYFEMLSVVFVCEKARLFLVVIVFSVSVN